MFAQSNSRIIMHASDCTRDTELCVCSRELCCVMSHDDVRLWISNYRGSTVTHLAVVRAKKCGRRLRAFSFCTTARYSPHKEWCDLPNSALSMRQAGVSNTVRSRFQCARILWMHWDLSNFSEELRMETPSLTHFILRVAKNLCSNYCVSRGRALSMIGNECNGSDCSSV